MLVVDSSVWIDFLAGRPQPACVTLERLLEEGEVRLVVPDLVLFEVLRGFRHEHEWRQARALLTALDVEAASDPSLAVEAAGHYNGAVCAPGTPESGRQAARALHHPRRTL